MSNVALATNVHLQLPICNQIKSNSSPQSSSRVSTGSLCRAKSNTGVFVARANSNMEAEYPQVDAIPDEDFPLEDLKELWKRGFAPWEEVHPAENHFALKSIFDCSEDTYKLPREVMDLLDKEKFKQMVKTEPEPFKLKEKTEYIDQPVIFARIPPRDWPPPGWKVDPEELAFIRETHTMYSNLEDPTDKELQNAKSIDDPTICMDRWQTFVKQYLEWVQANKASLDKEADLIDPQYEPGRRKTGERYRDGMYELPFIYPGQHYLGKVVFIHLHDGAFVDIGAVHDGWVGIQGNDWFKLRHIIQVGELVHVEVIAKRDPYRYRFPIELRFVYPNIDKDIFWRFKYPPIITRPGDTNIEELSRETGRPYVQELVPTFNNIPDPRDVCHPHIFKIWQIYATETMMLNKEEEEQGILQEEVIAEVPMEFTMDQWEEYINRGIVQCSQDDTSSDSEDEDDAKDEDAPESGVVQVLGPTDTVPLKTYVVRTKMAELDLDAAREERKMMRKVYEEANVREEAYVDVPMPRREAMMEELEEMHRQRCQEEQEALRRDIACRREGGLPLEDARYSDDPYHPNKYNPFKKIWQADYIGDPKKWKYGGLRRDKRPRQRMTMRRGN